MADKASWFRSRGEFVLAARRPADEGLVGRFRRGAGRGRLPGVGGRRERGGMNDEAQEEQRNHAGDDRAVAALLALNRGFFQGVIGDGIHGGTSAVRC